MSEMIEESLEVDEDAELDEEADAEVDKVLFEITDGKLGEMKTDLPVGNFIGNFILTSLI